MPATRRGPIAAALAAFLLATTAALPAALAQGCTDPSQGLGVSRVVVIDASDGPVFGSITKQDREKSFLKPKEVVLTFDDGPMPGVTKPILDVLDRYCTKATFFSVGKMAVAYPDLVREVMRRGHTMGTHTWSHPMSLPRLRVEQARDQIESGFAAVTLAAGEPIAPFFRFPGLNDSKALVGHLEGRNIATFTVDVVSNDSYITDVNRLIERTMSETQSENGGIMLFHDIKPQTVRALPEILSQLKAKGYKIVHLKSKHPFKVDERYTAAVGEHVAAKNPAAARMLMAITGRQPAPSPQVAASEDEEQATPPVAAAAASANTAGAAPAQIAAPIAPASKPDAEPQAQPPRQAAGRSTPTIINAEGAAATQPPAVTPVPPIAPAVAGIAPESAKETAKDAAKEAAEPTIPPAAAMTPESRAATRRMPRPATASKVETTPEATVAATAAATRPSIATPPQPVASVTTPVPVAPAIAATAPPAPPAPPPAETQREKAAPPVKAIVSTPATPPEPAKKLGAVTVINAPGAAKAAATATPIAEPRTTATMPAATSPAPATATAATPAIAPSASQPTAAAPAVPAAPLGFEVLAGSYDAKPKTVAGNTPPQTAPLALPEVLAGSYSNGSSRPSSKPTPAKRGEKTRDDSWQDRLRGQGQ